MGGQEVGRFVWSESEQRLVTAQVTNSYVKLYERNANIYTRMNN